MDREDGISKTPGESCIATRPWKYALHGSKVTRDQDTIILGSDAQNLWIESADRDCAGGWSKVYRRFSSE
jgi:hypothetical protein